MLGGGKGTKRDMLRYIYGLRNIGGPQTTVIYATHQKLVVMNGPIKTRNIAGLGRTGFRLVHLAMDFMMLPSDGSNYMGTDARMDICG